MLLKTPKNTKRRGQNPSMKPLTLIVSSLALSLCACGGGSSDDPFDPHVNTLTGDPATEMRGELSVEGMSIAPSTLRAFPASWSIRIGFSGSYGGSTEPARPFAMPYEITIDGNLAASGRADCTPEGRPSHHICTASGYFSGQAEGAHKMIGRPMPSNFLGRVWQPSEIAYVTRYVD
jgi:hypothetical protein